MAKARLQWMEQEEALELNEEVVRTACRDRFNSESGGGSIDWDSLDSTLDRYERSLH